MITKPMLAGKCSDVCKLQYPVYATPKLDGIRALKIDGALVSRNFKAIPNSHLRSIFEHILPDGTDGELILINGKPCGADFGKTSSAVMSEDGRPEVLYHAFDLVKDSARKPYLDRIYDLEHAVRSTYVRVLSPRKLDSESELLSYEKQCLSQGYEGIMLRTGDGPYKFGRSTEREGWLLKLKRFDDSEAIVLGFECKYSNQNEADEDAFGHTKRSSCKDGLVAMDTLGKLIVKDIHSDIEFGLGTGFDDAQRSNIWRNQAKYLGKIAKYKFQACGVKEKPRFPVFLGWRS